MCHHYIVFTLVYKTKQFLFISDGMLRTYIYETKPWVILIFKKFLDKNFNHIFLNQSDTFIQAQCIYFWKEKRFFCGIFSRFEISSPIPLTAPSWDPTFYQQDFVHTLCQFRCLSCNCIVRAFLQILCSTWDFS